MASSHMPKQMLPNFRHLSACLCRHLHLPLSICPSSSDLKKRFILSVDERGNGKYTDAGGYERVKVCRWDRSFHASSWPSADLPCSTAAVFEVPLCGSHFAQGLFLTILLRRIICSAEFFGIAQPDSTAAQSLAKAADPAWTGHLSQTSACHYRGRPQLLVWKKYTPALVQTHTPTWANGGRQVYASVSWWEMRCCLFSAWRSPPITCLEFHLSLLRIL